MLGTPPDANDKVAGDDVSVIGIRKRRRVAWAARSAIGASLVLALAAPALAVGDTRYASPTGSGDTCTEVSPCTLKTAINPGSFPGLGSPDDIQDGDTVIVLSEGANYNLGTVRLVVDHAITVRGEPGELRPTLASDVSGFQPAPLLQVTAPGATVEGLRVTVSGPQTEALDIASSAAPSTMRDIYVEGVDHDTSVPLASIEGASTLERAEIVRFHSATETNGETLHTTGDVLVRDSFIRNTGSEGAIRTFGPSTAARFRNLTVASGSTAIFGVGSFGPQQLSIRNSLIDGSTTDVAMTGAGVEASITYSNYNPGQISESGGATVTETPPNQDSTAPGLFPILVDPVSGDFRQRAGSPTIDAGSPDAFTGAFDIDGEPRTMGAAIDIGGDEFSPPPPPTEPSNAFEFGKLKRNKKKGTARLSVSLPGPGEIGLRGKKLQRIGLDSGKAASVGEDGGEVRLKVRPAKGKKGKRLRERLRTEGKAKVKAKVTYVPSGGTANTRAKKLKLVRR